MTAEALRATGTTLDALFRRSIGLFADRVALTCADDSSAGPAWTYRELGERADRLAAGLASLGVRRGDRVAVLSETRPEYVQAYVALARLGVTVVTLNVRLHLDELRHCLRTAAPVALLASGTFADAARGLRTDVREAVGFDPIPGFADLAEVCDTAAPAPDPAAEPGDVHNVLFTSGTTGLPKGAMVTQQASAVRAQRLAQWFALTGDDGFAGWLPLYHCGGDESLYATLLTGGRFCALRTADAATMFRVIERDRLTWTLLLPGVITDFLHHPDRTAHDLTSLRFAIGYANMMPTVVRDLTAACDIDFCDAFGQTETSYLLAHGWSGPGEVPHLRKTPAPLLEVALLDEHGAEVGVGVPGECAVRGPGVMAGYLDEPAATAEVFRGGWLHTGDVLVRGADGTLTFVDRTKYLIKTGGENVYPAEIEKVVATHEAVQEVCAFGVPDERWGETVKLVVVLSPGRTLTADDVVKLCREHLAGYKRPRYVQFVAADALPRSATGKLQRHVLAERGARAEERV